MMFRGPAPDFDLHLMGTDPIDDPRTFALWLRDSVERGLTIASDTETTGLEWWTPNFTRLVQFGTEEGGWAVPVGWYGRVVTWAMDFLRDRDARIVMHNASFDQHALAAHDYPWHLIHDTAIQAHLVAPHMTKALKPTARRVLGAWAGAGQDALKAMMNKGGYTWATIPVDAPEYWAYGIVDTCITAMLHDKLLPVVEEQGMMPAYERELKYQQIMFGCETRGMHVDLARTDEVMASYAAQADNLLAEIQAMGVENPNSNAMVDAALKDMGWVPTEFTPTGKSKLDKEVLARLAEFDGTMTGKLAQDLVRYKRLTNWTNSYLLPFRNSGGLIHPSINGLAAKTGRSSISNPPLQQIPSGVQDIRSCIVPPEKHKLVAIDYDGQELRITAAYAQEQAMLHEFMHGDGDIHSLVARQVYGEDFTKDNRRAAKVYNFASLYGAGISKLARGAGMSEMAMKAFVEGYNLRFPGIKRLKDTVDQQLQARMRDGERPYVITRGGRRAYVDPDKLYAGLNFLIQGSGADVLKEAAVRLSAVGLSDYIVAPVHDEAIFAFPEADAEEMTVVAREAMTDTEWFAPLVLTVDASDPVDDWGAAK